MSKNELEMVIESIGDIIDKTDRDIENAKPCSVELSVSYGENRTWKNIYQILNAINDGHAQEALDLLDSLKDGYTA